MLTLLTFPGGFEQPSHSPFCIKAMGLLEMSGQKWQPEYLSNPSKMPLSRLPVLKTSNGLVPDSAMIQSWLEARGAEFYSGLSDIQRAQAHAITRMVEENLRLGLVHDRWLNDTCWQITRDAFFKEIPAMLRPAIAGQVRKQARAGLVAHGIAQFAESDRRGRLEKDLDVLDQLLGSQKFLFGESPSGADVAVVPVLDGIRTLLVATGVRALVHETESLVAYVHRGRDAFYPSLPA